MTATRPVPKTVTQSPATLNTRKHTTVITPHRCNELMEFLHVVMKIVSVECFNRDSPDNLTWYSVWERWNEMCLYTIKNTCTIVYIISHEPHSTERTVSQILKRIIIDIIPIFSSLKITHITDTTAKWKFIRHGKGHPTLSGIKTMNL